MSFKVYPNTLANPAKNVIPLEANGTAPFVATNSFDPIWSPPLNGGIGQRTYIRVAMSGPIGATRPSLFLQTESGDEVPIDFFAAGPASIQAAVGGGGSTSRLWEAPLSHQRSIASR